MSLPALGAGTAVAQNRPTTSAAFFDAEGIRTPIAIRRDRVAIMLRPGVRVAQVKPALDRLGAAVGEEHPGVIVELRAKGTPTTLVSFARKLKAASDLIVAAGLAVDTGGRTPAILADEIIARLPDMKGEPMTKLFDTLGLRVVTENPFVGGQYLLRLIGDPKATALEVANKLRQQRAVEYAFPNFYSVAENYETIPTDPFFASQWHHRNTGSSGGTTTADARTTLAWDFTTGAPTTILGVNELFGFDVAHEDLAANLWTNTAETAANGIDDDGNGFVDDVHGWNFTACAATPGAGCGSAALAPTTDTADDAHATQVAGVAVARANDGLGVVGGCPDCRFMPFVNGSASSDFEKSLPFGYAQAKGATIVSNSWGGGGPFPSTTAAINTAATAGRGGLGIPIFFAAGNTAVDMCNGPSQQPLASLANVIGISSSSNRDRWVTSHGFGNCVALLAPTRWGAAEAIPSGTLAIATTDRTGHAGANDNNNDCLGALVNGANLNYSVCFSGTSSATPLAASVAGLILTQNAGLTAVQVRHALQDTADKIEDSAGAYAEATGYSSPASGTATHAFGRLNAFEAVRLVTPTAQGGKGGIDVFIRDNRLDWGNTDHPSNTLLEPTRGFIPHWQSVDVKVDAPPYQTAPTNNAQFESFTDENAQSGMLSRVYVRVRNRGATTAASVAVKAHWAFAGAGLPSLPADFWSTFPADSATTSVWHPLGVQTITNLAYSGASVANTGAPDAAQIVEFDFNGPAIDTTQPDPHHFCIFVVLNSAQDLAGPKAHAPLANDFIPDALTPTDNNVTHRNIVVEGTGGSSDFVDQVVIANPFNRPAHVTLTIMPRADWVKFDPFDAAEPQTLKALERRIVDVKIARVEGGYRETTLVQRTAAGEAAIYGGMTYRFGKPPKTKAGTLRFTRLGKVVPTPISNEGRPAK